MHTGNTHTLTHVHEYASVLRIYRPTHEHTHVHSHLCVCAHIHEQHAPTCTITDRQTNMLACNQSLTLTHTHSRVCAYSVCVRVCVRVCECVCV